ncbi:MAG: hypothetical protein ABIK32_01110, partial [Chloroflexota bacterium]
GGAGITIDGAGAGPGLEAGAGAGIGAGAGAGAAQAINTVASIIRAVNINSLFISASYLLKLSNKTVEGGKG